MQFQTNLISSIVLTTSIDHFFVVHWHVHILLLQYLVYCITEINCSGIVQAIRCHMHIVCIMIIIKILTGSNHAILEPVNPHNIMVYFTFSIRISNMVYRLVNNTPVDNVNLLQPIIEME